MGVVAVAAIRYFPLCWKLRELMVFVLVAVQKVFLFERRKVILHSTEVLGHHGRHFFGVDNFQSGVWHIKILDMKQSTF